MRNAITRLLTCIIPNTQNFRVICQERYQKASKSTPPLNPPLPFGTSMVELSWLKKRKSLFQGFCVLKIIIFITNLIFGIYICKLDFYIYTFSIKAQAKQILALKTCFLTNTVACQIFLKLSMVP